MKANPNFCNQTPRFWSLVSFLSEKGGYSKRGANEVLSLPYNIAVKILSTHNINFDETTLISACNYLTFRANTLNDFFEKNLMKLNEANDIFNLVSNTKDIPESLIPFNKQTGSKRHPAYYTTIINILTHQLLASLGHSNKFYCDYDPRKLLYVYDSTMTLIGTTSRRYDGALYCNNTPNCLAVWEIKEYYNTTSFGSRIADGVYETQLDGHEFQNIRNTTGVDIKHIYFIDAYDTWWKSGKSYLCRIFDILHMGLVDEVIVGREVLTRWPELLGEITSRNNAP